MNYEQIKGTIKYVFPFGSSVYGTKTSQSDEDYIVVIDGETPYKQTIEEEEGHIHVYSDASFRELLKKHDISAMECIFSNETEYKLELDLENLRNAISAVVSNSFTKCRKKLQKGEHYDPYGAKKSLFHSLRILDFGIQIATYGRIVEFERMNAHFHAIMAMETDDFAVYRKIYEPIGKELKAELKRLAPLEKDKRKSQDGW